MEFRKCIYMSLPFITNLIIINHKTNEILFNVLLNSLNIYCFYLTTNRKLIASIIYYLSTINILALSIDHKDNEEVKIVSILYMILLLFSCVLGICHILETIYKIDTNLYFCRINQDAIIPKKGTSKSAGIDIFTYYNFTLKSKERLLIKTGLRTVIPENYYMHLFPRSGLSLKNGIQVFAGVIDQDYSNEIGVILYNSGNVDKEFNKGDAICQAIILPTIQMCCREIDCLEYENAMKIINVDRTGGFGSTDRKIQ